ncbi:hemerythrin domain-containing protein [Azospirillum sp.]|uniref:bacteriohemerythrin n=1 Tax=Azospirillum sp. TaxID=34012 RepID=UPI002D256313|nr:hemerythrin domain-containing protein [Azospirillum sp.]HYD64903.1 hemerythrin domain-containing protein [Azospirillum sp.]
MKTPPNGTPQGEAMNVDHHPVPETGNRFIDGTHAALVRRIGQIRERCDGGAPREQIAPVLDALTADLHAHFACEELIIRALGHDGWEEHAEQHELLNTQVGRLVAYVRECDVSRDFLSTVAGTLDTVLCRHETRYDGSYAALLKAAAPGAGRDLIAWGAEHETGIPTIDQQHRGLVGMLNDLHRAAAAGLAPADALRRVDGLRDHVHAHFGMEEGVVRAMAPGRFLQHRAHHAVMAQQFEGIRAEIADGTLDVGVAVRDFLRFWLMDHILGCDRPLLCGAH